MQSGKDGRSHSIFSNLCKISKNWLLILKVLYEVHQSILIMLDDKLDLSGTSMFLASVQFAHHRLEIERPIAWQKQDRTSNNNRSVYFFY